MAFEENKQVDYAHDVNPSKNEKPLPFNNLFLNAGAINGFNKPWMYIITFCLALIGYFLYQSVIAIPLVDRLLHNGYTLEQISENPNLILDSTALQMDPNYILVLELGMFVFALVGLFFGVQFIHHKPFKSVLTGYNKFRFRKFWFAVGLWTLLQMVLTTVSYALSPNEFELVFSLRGWLVSAAIMLVLMPLQTGFEEVFFRSYFIQGLAQIFKNGWLPVIIMSLLFAFAHMSNPEVKKYGVTVMFTYYASFALFLGFLTLLDEGIELAFGIHFANNIVSSLLVTSDDSVIKTYAIFKTSSYNPIAEIIIWFVMALISFFIFRLRYRWSDFSLIRR